MIQVADLPWLAPAPATAPRMLRVRVEMAFLLRGQRQEIGAELLLPEALARELIGYRKVRRIEDEPPQPAAAPPAPQVTRARKSKKDPSHAQQ